MNVLGVEIHFEFNTPTHPDVDYRLSMARKSFFGMSNYFRCSAVSIRDKFWRYQEKVQGIAMYGIEGMTLDNHSFQRMHSVEGFCLCKMFTCPRGPEENVSTWSRRRYAEARRKFQEMVEECRSNMALCTCVLVCIWCDVGSYSYGRFGVPAHEFLLSGIQSDETPTRRGLGNRATTLDPHVFGVLRPQLVGGVPCYAWDL
ncbi:unnamed protein product [Prorocentrum cordatum]|uniref:Uncharacterized protein n=1 Tax=Prorocentrum cordatum TaxID=2364126 RepID=A0ABN9RKF2_9DINO|nr:unnamed protein product [Polarella glacialis]